jgi:hypothetical protein
MSKTAKEWFEQLPEPYRTQAIENWEKSKISDKENPVISLNWALDTFIWKKTIQGGDYWQVIWDRAFKGEFDTPQPNLNGWIPVSERLPTKEDADEFGKVLVLRDVIESQINNCKSITDWNLVKHCDKETTMWQPLPKLPEKL